MSATSDNSKSSSSELGSVNLIQLILQHKRLYLIVGVLAIIGSAAVSLVIPEKFKSTLTLFPTVPQNSLGQALTDRNAESDVHLLSYGAKIDGERFLQIINSATVRDHVIEANNLYDHYQIDPDGPKAKAYIYDEYGSNVSANMTRYESIEIEVFDQDPQIAAAIANSIASFSDSLELQIRIQRSGNAYRKASEEHSNLNRESKFYEDSLSVLREKGVIDFFSQIPGLTEEFAEAIGEGHADRANVILERLDTLGKYGNTYIRQSKKLERIREIQDLVYRRMVAFRVDQGSHLSSTFIIDSATPADKKSYPIRWLIVVLTTGAVIFLLTVVLLILENFKEEKA